MILSLCTILSLEVLLQLTLTYDVGIYAQVLSQIEALGSTNIHLNLIATKPGIQKITGITVFDTRGMKSYEPLPDLEIFVDID